ncbi:MAG: tyrosine-type recombinase/integrase [Planctomycetales bacterium]|nr:tyrosine-type recombinase/integrase [Planctomycetales bacterium]
MASLQQEPTGVFHVVFRHRGKRFKRSLNTKSQSTALARCDEINETLDLIKRGRLGIPPGVAQDQFILAGGKMLEGPSQSAADTMTEIPSVSLKGLFDRFFEALPADSLELNTVRTMRTHQKHLLRILGARTKIHDLKNAHLQKYITSRSKEKTQFLMIHKGLELPKKRQVSGVTIKKEIVTLGIVWRWAIATSLVELVYPSKGLRYPKHDEKPPFRTYDEIRRQIESLGLTGSNAAQLWDCLFLSSIEIQHLLEVVGNRQHGLPSYAYPMIFVAAHTGARRSELIRAKVMDVDLSSNSLVIREKKRVRGSRSSRQVPISTPLRQALVAWLERHPGGDILFCCEPNVELSCAQVRRVFRTAVRGTKWSIMRGWHTLRHSFISNLACQSIDQRIIDAFVGHTTDEMRQRYRHLFPNIQHSAIEQVFG